MNQLSSITPLEIILIGSAAVGVFLFFRACWRNIKRSRQHLGVALLTLMMSLTAQTAWANNVMYVIATELSDNITIIQRNEDGNTSNFSVKKVKLTFYYGERPTGYTEGSEVWSQRTESFGGSCIFDVPTDVPTSNDYHYPAWYVNSSKNAAKRHEAVTLISFDASFADARPKSTAYWFYNMKNLTSNNIDFTNLNTSSTKSMNHMFFGCKSIQNLDLSGWNVAKVTNMSYMFEGCDLTSIDLSGWNVAQVTDMTRMFYQCSKLTTINLNGWNVTNLKRTSFMFSGCSALTNIYCEGSWDTNTLTIQNSQDMFKDCTSLPGYPSNPARNDLNKKKAKPQPDGYFSSIVLGTLTLDKNITASGYSTVEYDSKTYCYGTVTLGYTGTVPTGGIVKYAVNDEYIDGNTFTIRGDAKVTAVVVYPYTNISGLTYVGATTVISGTTYAMTSNGYYEIADEQDLIDLGNYAAANSTNKCYGLTFKLTADLDFSSRTTDDCQNGYGHGNYIPIIDFYGTFNGQGHTITGLRFTSEGSCGLFGRIVSPAIVKNVTLINPQFTGTSSTGAIAGGADGGTFESCTVAGGILSSTGESCGGILGWAKSKNYHVNITSCIVVNTSVSSPDNKGIILGGRDNGSYEVKCRKCCYHSPEGLPGRSDNPIDYNFFRVYQVTLGEGVTVTNKPVYAYGNKAYCQDAYTLTLGHNRPGYVFGGYQSDDVTITDGSFDMPQKDIIVNADWTDMFGMESGADGSAEHPYLISSTAGWDFFCDALQDNDTYNRFSGKTVKLAPSSGNSISVTRMAGSSQHDFTGTFDGDGKTLTVSYGTEAAPVSEEYAAPFRFVDGATIQNLHVEGSIISTVRRAAGVIGETGDNTSHITNCVSSSTISGGNFTGGFSIGGNVEIDGCVYNGKINGSGNSGGFVGYSQPTLKITNCLFAPQSGSSISGGTFYYNGGGNITPVNSYYTQKLGTAQGKQAYEVSAAPELLGEGTGEGIVKTYEYGLGFDNKYYLGTIPLSETEGVSYLTDYLQGLEVPAEFKRTFSAGKASTICLPFAMDNVSGGKVYSFAGITYDEKDGWVATMSETETDGNNVTSTKANTPYVFMPDADGEVTFSGTTDEIPAAYDAKELSTVSGDWTFRGTYEQLKYGSNLDGHVYGFASRDKEVDGVNVAAGEFVKAKDGAGVKPMRCYLTYKDNQEFVGARAVTRGIEENLPQSITVRFLSSTGNTTAIATLNTQTGEITTDDAWYTLSGTRLPGKPSQRGIYINKGNKVVIR